MPKHFSTRFGALAARLGIAAVLLAGTLAVAAPPAAAGTGGCSFSGTYGITSHPDFNNLNVAGQRAALVGPTAFVTPTGCTTGVIYVTAVPVASVNGTIVRVGTPMFCTLVLPYLPTVLVGAGCGTVGSPLAVEVNEVQFLMTAEAAFVASNGGHAEAVASCLVTWNNYGDDSGAAGPRCPISG